MNLRFFAWRDFSEVEGHHLEGHVLSPGAGHPRCPKPSQGSTPPLLAPTPAIRAMYVRAFVRSLFINRLLNNSWYVADGKVARHFSFKTSHMSLFMDFNAVLSTRIYY